MSDSPILMTGVSQRLGFHCAKALAEAGHSVIGSFRQWEKNSTNLALLESLGVKLIQADFTDEASTTAFIEAVKATTDTLSALIHNASTWAKDAEVGHDQHEEAQKMMAVHMIAPYRMNLAFESLLAAGAESTATGKSDVIHVTDYVVQAGSDHHIAYAASKAALANMTLSFSRRFAPAIKVNSVEPSLIMFNQHDDDQYREKALSKSLLQIEPGADVMLSTLQFILNNPYLTGQTLTLDGGRSVKRS